MSKSAGKKVYVLKAWNARSRKATLKVYSKREAAERQLDKLLEKKGKTYGGVFERKIG